MSSKRVILARIFNIVSGLLAIYAVIEAYIVDSLYIALVRADMNQSHSSYYVILGVLSGVVFGYTIRYWKRHQR